METAPLWDNHEAHALKIVSDFRRFYLFLHVVLNSTNFQQLNEISYKPDGQFVIQAGRTISQTQRLSFQILLREEIPLEY